MAVLHCGQGKNDRGVDGQQGSHHGLSGGETSGTWKKTLLHYIENTGDTDLIFLEMFKSSHYQDLFAFRMADAHAAGACDGPPAY